MIIDQNALDHLFPSILSSGAIKFRGGSLASLCIDESLRHQFSRVPFIEGQGSSGEEVECTNSGWAPESE